MQIMFFMLFQIFLSQNLNLVDNLTNLAKNRKKVGPLRTCGACFIQLWPSGGISWEGQFP